MAKKKTKDLYGLQAGRAVDMMLKHSEEARRLTDKELGRWILDNIWAGLDATSTESAMTEEAARRLIKE